MLDSQILHHVRPNNVLKRLKQSLQDTDKKDAVSQYLNNRAINKESLPVQYVDDHDTEHVRYCGSHTKLYK